MQPSRVSKLKLECEESAMIHFRHKKCDTHRVIVLQMALWFLVAISGEVALVVHDRMNEFLSKRNSAFTISILRSFKQIKTPIVYALDRASVETLEMGKYVPLFIYFSIRRMLKEHLMIQIGLFYIIKGFFFFFLIFIIDCQRDFYSV